jgi:hypothetical protein
MELLHRHQVARLEGDGLMTNETIWADIPFGTWGFVVYVAMVAIALRLPWTNSPARATIGLALFAYFMVLAAAAVLGRNANFWTVSIVFWFPALLFLMGFGAVYKSISFRILLDLLDRPGRTELYSAILARYVATESFENRLAVMQEHGFAVLTSAGFELTDKGRRLAKVISAMQRLFAIQRSG